MGISISLLDVAARSARASPADIMYSAWALAKQILDTRPGIR